MTYAPSGHIEQLPSGSWRAKVYAGKDPLTGREIRFRKTRRTEVEAQIELGRLLELARAGRNPDSGVTVAELLDAYVPVAGWDVSTEEANLGYIRRTIKPALGTREVRKVRGPLLDNLYARLQKCGDLACTGKPFTEHRHVPDLRPGPASPRTNWQQTAAKLREAITCGALVPGDDLPSVSELARLQGLKPGTIQHAFLELAEQGLLVIRHGRPAQIAGDPPADSNPASRYRAARSRPGHDCALSGCQPHACHPMKPSTIHGIHAILSGAFEAAQRWEWVDFNPAESAKPPTVTKKKTPATPPGTVVAVIEQARNAGKPAIALYVWLAAITGVRRGELCGVQIRDIDLDNGWLHVAFNYVVKGGKKIRKDTKTHQDRYPAIDPVTCALIREHLAAVAAALAGHRRETRAVRLPVLQPPREYATVEPRLGKPPRRGPGGRGRSPAQHQGPAPLHRQPAPRRRVRPRQHSRPARPLRRRRHHPQALRRPSLRSRPARRRLPRTAHHRAGRRAADCGAVR